MSVLLAVVVLAALVPLAGGRLARLADVRIEYGALAVVALVVQGVLLQYLGGDLPRPVAAGLYASTTAAALVVAWANRHLLGLAVVCVGGALNLAVLTANSGVVPVAPEAASERAETTDGDSYRNAEVVDEPRLAFLGDVVAMPFPAPFDSALSVGDLFLVAGAGLVLHSSCVRAPHGEPEAMTRAGAGAVPRDRGGAPPVS